MCIPILLIKNARVIYFLKNKSHSQNYQHTNVSQLPFHEFIVWFVSSSQK